MARAESASASAHSDSIKGLAQAVARPAYRRLLTAEPFLRRAVPVLIVAFLATLGVAAFVDVYFTALPLGSAAALALTTIVLAVALFLSAASAGRAVRVPSPSPHT